MSDLVSKVSKIIDDLKNPNSDLFKKTPAKVRETTIDYLERVKKEELERPAKKRKHQGLKTFTVFK